jgi:hypothetical protein
MTQSAKKFADAETSRQAARRYIRRGWKPLAVDAGNKGPFAKGWPSWPVGDDADAYASRQTPHGMMLLLKPAKMKTEARPNNKMARLFTQAGLSEVQKDARQYTEG